MIDGSKVERLRGDIIHHTIDNLAHHGAMIAERYAPLGALQMYDDGRRTSPVKAAFSAWFTFVRGYFLKLGFLDGFEGFCIAYFAAHNTFLKHAMLIEMRRGPRETP